MSKQNGGKEGVTEKALSTGYECNSIQDVGKCIQQLKFDIEKDMNIFHEQMKEIKVEVREAKSSIEWNAQEIETVKVDMNEISKEIITRELWSRKWNLIFRGIPGNLTEKACESEEVIRNFIEKDLAISHDCAANMIFAAVHRIPSGPKEKKNITVRFIRLDDRDKCLEGAYQLPSGSGKGVSVDLPPPLAKERDRLLKIRKALPDAVKKAAKIKYLKTHPFLVLKYGKKEVVADPNYTYKKETVAEMDME